MPKKLLNPLKKAKKFSQKKVQAKKFTHSNESPNLNFAITQITFLKKIF
jgi:hypothetical protein